MKRLMFLCALNVLICAGLSAQNYVPRTYTPNNRVFDLDRKGDTLYAVGSFTYVGVESGGAGWIPATDSLPNVNFPVIDGTVRSVIPDGQGGWYVGGDFDQAGDITCNNLVHIFPGGTVDQNFLPDVNNDIHALAVFNDTMMIGGRFTQIDGQDRERLAAFDLNSGNLSSWNPGANSTVNALAVVDGSLMVGGQFTRIGGRYQPGMARLSIQGGQMLPTLSPALGTVHSFTLDGQKLYTAGSFNSQVGRFTGRGAAFQGQDASPLVNFPRFNGTIRTIKEDGNGGWYVGGDFFQVDGQNISRLAHILPDGTVDPSFSLSLNSSVYDLMVFNDTMMIAGSFQSILGQTRRRLAAIDIPTLSLLSWDPEADNTVTSLETDGTYIFVGGSFSSIGGRQQPKLAILDKQTGVPFQTPSPVSGQVNALGWNDTMMFAGGSFTGANGLAASRLTLLSDNATIPSPTFPTFNNTVYDIESDGNGGWYVAGAFTQVNGNTLRRLAHILPDSTVDPNFDFNINNAIYDIAIFNDTMMIAGAFTSINGTSQERIAAVNLINDTLFTWNPGVNGIIRSLQKVGATLYMGGNFTDVGGQARNRAAAVDLPSGNVLPWNPDFNNTIYQLAWNDTMMIAMGSFTTVGGQTRNRLAALDPASALPLSWDPNVNNQIRGGSIDGNLLYIGGLFSQVGGQSRSRLAAIDLATGAVQAWDPGASSTVETISIEGNVLYVGGGFTQAAGQDRLRAAAFDLPGGGLRSWTPDASATVYTFGTQGNQVMMGGSFTALQAESRNYLMALDRSDFARSVWAPTPNGVINDLKVFNDTIMLAGTFTSLDGQPRSRLAMVNDANTPSVLAWDPGADATVRGLHVFNDTILVAGNFSQLGGQDRSFLGAVTISSGQPLDWNPQPNTDVYTVSRSGGITMAGGAFDTYESEGRSRVLCLDLSADSLTAWHPGLSGFGAPQAYDIALSPAGIWVGGSFGTIGDSARQNLALTDPLTGEVLPIHVPADDRVYALEVVGDSLWVGGNFDSLQGQFRAKLGVINSNTGTPFSYQPNANDETRFLAWNDTMMVVGGEFSHLIGRERRGGYAVDTKTGQLTPWNPDLGLNDFINTMEIDEKNGDIYLGGSFDEVGGLPRENLAKVDVNTGLVDSAWQADGGFLMFDLAWDPREEQLYVAGNFTEIGGQPRNYLARLNADGSVDSWNPSPNDQVRDLAWNDTMMFAAGSFTSIAGVNRDGLAAIQVNGQASDWNPEITGLFGLSAGVSAIEVSADRIYLGGNFRQINGASRDRLAAFDRTTGELLPWRVPVDSSLISTNIGINQIRLRDENLFVSGLFSEINGTQTDNFAWIDAKSGLTQGLRTNINNLVFDVEVLDSLVYLGGDFFDAEDTYTPNIATYRVGSPEFQEKPVSLQPKVGGNNGDVTVHIFGAGFTTYPTVILRKAGLDDVVAIDSLTRIFFGNQIRATFNLRNAPLGLRDVWIIGNGDTTIVEDGFRVVQGREPRVYADVINPRRIRFNPTSPGHTLRISYGNAGSIDAEGVPIWLALSSNLNLADIQIEFLDYPANIPPGDSILPFVPTERPSTRAR
ncbi:MAG: delta-60 repeat domain-containing protein [Bacteroidota bacterium]